MLRESAQSLVGQILGGTYSVHGVLGHGGMGVVYAARNVRTDGMVAVKVLHRSVARKRDLYARFLNEARVTSALRHPNIVQVFDLAELPDGRPYIVMEYLEGEDLAARLSREGPLQAAQALHIVREVGAALQLAHKLQIIHRDVKPSNIFLLRAGDDRNSAEHVKIIDFGISRFHGPLIDPHITHDSIMLGTLMYMSPEAAKGLNSQVDARSDQFALAVITYQMLSGRCPFQDKSELMTLYQIAHEPPPPLDALRPGLPPSMLAAIDRALSKRKEDRFETILDFVRELERAIEPSASLLPSSLAIRHSAPKRASGIPEGQSDRTTPSIAATPAGGRAPRLLIIDDDEELAVLLLTIFGYEGYICRTVGDGAKAMDAILEFRPDLVLLDVMLPGKNGYKLCWEIKSHPQIQKIPVLLVSAKVQDVDHKLGMAMQADGYVDKPFDIAKLVALVRSHVSWPLSRTGTSEVDP